MLEYKPWSQKIVNPLIENSNNELPILDIQLGGACNLRCIYCDTPNYSEPCLIDLPTIQRLIDEGNVKQIYICGLGEPTAISKKLELNNMYFLKCILEMCKQKLIYASIFTNLLELDSELLDYIDSGVLYVLYKLDTLDIRNMQYLYSASEKQAKRLLQNYELINEVIHKDSTSTNIGVSLVPTNTNYHEIPYIFERNEKLGIYTLLGQLENAGNASKCSNCNGCTKIGNCTNIFVNEGVSVANLLALKSWTKLNYGIDYETPLCAASLASVHISNRNQVICDEKAGFSCPWPWLDEPKIKIIGDARNISYEQITQSILSYKASRIDAVLKMSEDIEYYPFGGCGGNIKKLLKTHLDCYKKRN